MRCGWMPSAEWPAAAPDLPQFEIDGIVQHPPVCPGWLQKQPLAGEVGQAWRSFEKGQLGETFPDAPNVLVEGVFLLDHAITKHQADERERQKANPPP